MNGECVTIEELEILKGILPSISTWTLEELGQLATRLSRIAHRIPITIEEWHFGHLEDDVYKEEKEILALKREVQDLHQQLSKLNKLNKRETTVNQSALIPPAEREERILQLIRTQGSFLGGEAHRKASGLNKHMWFDTLRDLVQKGIVIRTRTAAGRYLYSLPEQNTEQSAHSVTN